MSHDNKTLNNPDRRDFLKVSLGLALTSTGGVSVMSLAAA